MNGVDLTRLRAHVGGLAASSLDAARKRALEALETDGLPSTHHEDWKYTDLADVAAISDAWLTRPHTPTATAAGDAFIDELKSAADIDWILLRNGTIEALYATAPEGVVTSRLSENPPPDAPTNALTALNTALIADGLVIQVEANAVRPLGLLFLDDADDGTAALSQTRVDIQVAAGSAVDIVEYHASFGDSPHYSNAVLTLDLAEHAVARHLRVQNRGRGHSLTQRLDVLLAAGARFRSAAFDLGGKLSRNDLTVDLAAKDASAEFDGLYLTGEDQHMDNHTRVDHRVGPATSRQAYRGILFGRARGVWNGKAVVHEGADGTDAEQANHNLLLSEHAEIDTKPELEIYAEDVRCSHGTTVGQLDEKALFYLRSRGLSGDEARRLLVRAFAARTLEALPFGTLDAHLEALLDTRLTEIKDISVSV